MDSQPPIDGNLLYGNDDPPLMNKVPEPPPSHWGKVMTDRSASEAYTRFRLRARKTHEKPQDNGG